MLCKLHSVYNTLHTLCDITQKVSNHYTVEGQFFAFNLEKNYTGQKIFTQTPSVASVTNMRYDYLKYDIKIQWLITHHAMRTICLLNLLPFLHSAPEPDTHLHVHLPQESEQGNSVLVASFSTVSSKGLKRLEGL